jgi:hypothetical protein
VAAAYTIAYCDGTGNTSLTTPSINTTGADLLIVAAVCYTIAPTVSLSDNKTNTWYPLTAYGAASWANVKIFYAYNPTVGTGHTFSLSGSGSPEMNCVGIAVLALSGMDITSSVYQASSDHGAVEDDAGDRTIQPGSVTPANIGDVIVTVWNAGNSTQSTGPSINSSFVIPTGIGVGWAYDGNNQDIGIAYKIVSTTDAVNPTWSADSDTQYACSIAVFKAAAGGGATAIPNKKRISTLLRR